MWDFERQSKYVESVLQCSMYTQRYRGAGGWGANRGRQIRSNATLVWEPGYIFY